MKQRRFTEEQFVAILKDAEGGGTKIAELCRRHGISYATFYDRPSKSGGLEVSELCRLRRSRTKTGG